MSLYRLFVFRLFKQTIHYKCIEYRHFYRFCDDQPFPWNIYSIFGNSCSTQLTHRPRERDGEWTELQLRRNGEKYPKSEKHSDRVSLTRITWTLNDSRFDKIDEMKSSIPIIVFIAMLKHFYLISKRFSLLSRALPLSFIRLWFLFPQFCFLFALSITYCIRCLISKTICLCKCKWCVLNVHYLPLYWLWTENERGRERSKKNETNHNKRPNRNTFVRLSCFSTSISLALFVPIQLVIVAFHFIQTMFYLPLMI